MRHIYSTHTLMGIRGGGDGGYTGHRVHTHLWVSVGGETGAIRVIGL